MWAEGPVLGTQALGARAPSAASDKWGHQGPQATPPCRLQPQRLGQEVWASNLCPLTHLRHSGPRRTWVTAEVTDPLPTLRQQFRLIPGCLRTGPSSTFLFHHNLWGGSDLKPPSGDIPKGSTADPPRPRPASTQG